ncbi:hypothetical protein M405DRAFT_867022 [Rhizopogon salebrosus TDB-379]|nr:hypothetical protein M405DRAFT_867022 [Rhizopogon salebrosus TDB-379]
MNRANDFETLAIWENILLSPLHSDHINRYLKEHGSDNSRIFVQLFRTADNLLCDYVTIKDCFPAPALSIRMCSQRIKYLSCLLTDKDHITAAIDYAIDAVNNTASQNVPGSGRMFLNVPHFSTEHEGCYHPTSPSIAPQSPPRSPSLIPARDKGKGREDPEDDEEELEYYSPKAPSPSLPPPIFLADPSPIPLALTTLIKTAPSSPEGSPLTPALSTPDERLFSDPPHSDPAFENVICRLCSTIGHKQAKCQKYFCRFCRLRKPGHLSPFCPYRGRIPFHSSVGRITHFPFHFPLNASDPDFFYHLDKWEKDDDRNFYKISSFLYMSAPSADYGPLSIARLKELTGLGETPENPIEVD